MANTHIKSHSELLLRISELKVIKEVQEAELKITLIDLVSTLNLISLFNGTAIKKEQPIELLKLGLNKVVDLIIDFTLGRNRSLKGFLSSVLVEKFTASLINNNLINVISAISSMLRVKHIRNTETETDSETNKI